MAGWDYFQGGEMDRFGSTMRSARRLFSRFNLRVCTGSFLIGLMISSTVLADSAAPSQATSSLQSRQRALQSIPFEQLSAVKRRKIEHVVNRPSVYRRLPIQSINCDPQLFTFLVRHPEVVINMWQLMGATKMQFQRTGPYNFQFSDGAGTTSRVELVYGTPNLHVFYAEGIYKGPLIGRALRGKCVMVLNSGKHQSQGRSYLTSRLDVFLQVDQLGVELLAKTLHPLLGSTIDRNYADTVRFVGQLSLASARNRAGMERLTARLTKVDPAVRSRLNQIMSKVVDPMQASSDRIASPLPSVRSSRRVKRFSGTPR